MNMNLRELYLADNKLNGLQDSAQLGNLLKFNYNIQILDLRNNHILDSGKKQWFIYLFFYSFVFSGWNFLLDLWTVMSFHKIRDLNNNKKNLSQIFNLLYDNQNRTKCVTQTSKQGTFLFPL